MRREGGSEQRGDAYGVVVQSVTHRRLSRRISRRSQGSLHALAQSMRIPWAKLRAESRSPLCASLIVSTPAGPSSLRKAVQLTSIFWSGWILPLPQWTSVLPLSLARHSPSAAAPGLEALNAVDRDLSRLELVR